MTVEQLRPPRLETAIKMLRSISRPPEQARPTLGQLQAVLRCVMLHTS
ncbi:MAG TPA: hypothetical protein VIT22_08405 [Pseudoxanthomonas sp.]